MSRRNTRSQAAVERLLDERRQYQEWLDKLAAPAAAGAPTPVVERVRADYQSRLDAVTRQLSRHEGELEAALAEAEQRRDQAAGQRAAVQEALAEAVLRHDVGEYDDEKFAALSAEHTASLAQLGEELESADRDIARLEEILALIARVFTGAPPAAVPAADETAALPLGAAATANAAPTPPGAERPVSPAAPPVAEGLDTGVTALGRLDELSFLRSVAAPPKGGTIAPPGGRAAAPAPRTATPAAPPAPPPAPTREPAAAEPAPPPAVAMPVLEPPPAPRPERSTQSRKLEASLPPPPQHPVPEAPEAKGPRPSKRSSAAVPEADEDASRKTLRCTECGTSNLPTEWYCEKCGAELSAF